MALIDVVDHAAHRTDEVERFNARLRAGGARPQFPAHHVPAWLPKVSGRTIFQEYHLAVDQHGTVRGGYVLKRQEFLIGGETLSIAHYRNPVSEGIVDKAHSPVGLKMLLDARRRQPFLYCLGMGSYARPLPRMIAGMGWSLWSVPFFFRVVRPFPFLRKIAFLRRTAPRRALLDVLAFSGLGWLAVKTVQAARKRNAPGATGLKVEIVDEFGDWADRIWETAKDDYGMIAVRTGEVLRILYPADDPRFIRLKVSERGSPIGWCVLLAARFSNHKQFGTLRVGTFVDGLAPIADARSIVEAATAELERHGVDLIVSNQSHRDWAAAFDSSGYLRGPSNFLFGASRKLARRLATSGVANDAIYVNRGDGDGPIHLDGDDRPAPPNAAPFRANRSGHSPQNR